MQEHERAALYSAMKVPNRSPSSPQYALPFCKAVSLEMATLPLALVVQLLQILHQLDLYNQACGKQGLWFEKTFEDLSNTNRLVLEANLREIDASNGKRAEELVALISELLRKNSG